MKVPFQFLIAAFLYISGIFLHPHLLNVDVNLVSTQAVVGVLFVFSFFVMSVLSWGRVLSRALHFEEFGISGSFLFGTIGAVTTAFILGHLGWMSPSLFPLHSFLLLLAPFLIEVFLRKNLRSKSRKKFSISKLDQWSQVSLAVWGISVLYTLIIYFNWTLFPSFNADVFSYHLYAPRIWYDEGQVFFPTFAPVVYVASYWEYIYLWPFLMFKPSPEVGYLEIQWFTQWTHFFFGQIGSFFVLSFLLEKIFKKQWWIYPITFFSVFYPFALQGMGIISKNDWAPVLWTLPVFISFYEYREKRKLKYLVLSGFLLGFTFAAKFVSGFYILPMMLFFVFEIYRHSKASRSRTLWKSRCFNAAGLGVPFLIAMLPLLIRNFIHTANPFFPALNNWFVSPWLAFGNLLDQTTHSSSVLGVNIEFFERFSIAIQDFPLMILFFLFPLVFLFKQKDRKWLPIWSVCFFSMAGLFLTELGSKFWFYRWLGPVIIMSASLALLMVVVYLKPSKKWETHWVSGVIFVFSLSTLFPVSSFRRETTWSGFYVQSHPKQIQEIYQTSRFHLAGDSKSYLRKISNRDDLILSTADTTFYSVSQLNIASFFFSKLFRGNLTREKVSLQTYLQELKKLGVRYILDARHFSGQFWGKASLDLYPLLVRHPEAVLFQGTTSAVIDFEKLFLNAGAFCSKDNEISILSQVMINQLKRRALRFPDR